jgi:hypothetical protein
MDDRTQQIHIETAVSVLRDGRALFSDLVTGSDDLLVENLYALKADALRAIVFERVIAARTAQRLGPDSGIEHGIGTALAEKARACGPFRWSGRRDLNSGPPVPQTGALTRLRHAPWGSA